MRSLKESKELIGLKITASLPSHLEGDSHSFLVTRTGAFANLPISSYPPGANRERSRTPSPQNSPRLHNESCNIAPLTPSQSPVSRENGMRTKNLPNSEQCPGEVHRQGVRVITPAPPIQNSLSPVYCLPCPFEYSSGLV